jgi:Xaa-Pro aminopeptidase
MAQSELHLRVGRLRDTFKGFDALLVTNLVNVRYLTGFTGSAALLGVTKDRCVLATDGRYRTQAAEQIAASGAPVEVVIQARGQENTTLLSVLGEAETVGLESASITWASAMGWEKRLPRIVATERVIESLREIKDAHEIELMTKAAAIADNALEEVKDLMSSKAGSITEEEFALALDSAMRRGGAEDVAFSTIVASGPNSAKPHHHPGSRIIEKGDPVVVDFGATYEGYRSDMTRTFSIGAAPSGKFKEIYDIVAHAQRAGVAAVKSGAEAKAVDAVCRDHINEAGYGEYFEHGTGHAVGLDIHEDPRISYGYDAILAPGMVVTVEPGIYLPGIAGVRIEDTLAVTADGSVPLTKFPKSVVA